MFQTYYFLGESYPSHFEFPNFKKVIMFTKRQKHPFKNLIIFSVYRGRIEVELQKKKLVYSL